MDWHLYLDESYTAKTLCVGGLLAPVSMWKDIEAKWKERIQYENRISAKKEFPPVSRYHATDCANLKKEFAESKGWTVLRQIRLTKRLCELLTTTGPVALAYGGSLATAREVFSVEPDVARRLLYKAALLMHMIVVEEIFHERFPGSRVRIFCERSTHFGALAEHAFRAALDEPRARAANAAQHFTDLLQVGWEDHIALQSADFIAYEAMKRIEGAACGRNDVRKPLRSLKARHMMPIRIERFTEQNFKDILKMNQNRIEGRSLSEGVDSRLAISDSQSGGLFEE